MCWPHRFLGNCATACYLPNHPSVANVAGNVSNVAGNLRGCQSFPWLPPATESTRLSSGKGLEEPASTCLFSAVNETWNDHNKPINNPLWFPLRGSLGSIPAPKFISGYPGTRATGLAPRLAVHGVPEARSADSPKPIGCSSFPEGTEPNL